MARFCVRRSMHRGFIKIWRKIEDWEWSNDPNTFCLLIHLILLANHKDKKWRGIVIKKGSFITSYANLSERTGLSVRQIRTSLSKLKSTGEVTSKATNRYTVIYLNKYDLYHEESTSKVTSKRQASDKQATTTKNDKNDKKLFISKDINKVKPKSDSYGNFYVNELIRVFTKYKHHEPIDTQARREAWSLAVSMKSWIKKQMPEGVELSEEQMQSKFTEATEKYFAWSAKQSWFEPVKRMSAMRENFKLINNK